MQISEQQIYDAAPLFFRLKTEGYFDPDDAMAPDIQAIRIELGLGAHVQEKRYPPIHYWGIECGQGWFDIVRDAATKIEVLLNAMVTAGTAVDDLPGCTQIKEKFGGLRLGWRAVEAVPITQPMQSVIARMCGSPGLNASDVNGVAEVRDVLGFAQPRGLTGGLAGTPAWGG